MIKLKVSRGGSGKGNGYYGKILACGAKATLEKLYPPEGLPEGNAEIGSIFHAHMDHFYTSQEPYEPNDVEFTEPLNELCRLEADRLAKWYMLNFKPTDFGKVIDTEMRLPQNDKQEALLFKQLGFEYTTQLDLVVKLTQKDIDRLLSTMPCEERSIVGPLTPGVWLIDHKTESRDDFHDRLMYSRQFVGQQVLWNATQKTPAQGVLVNVVVKTKKPWSRILVIPGPPAEHDVLGWKHSIERAVWLEQNDPTHVNDRECVTYGRVCRHFNEGRCDRSPLTSAKLLKVLQEK